MRAFLVMMAGLYILWWLGFVDFRTLSACISGFGRWVLLTSGLGVHAFLVMVAGFC